MSTSTSDAQPAKGTNGPWGQAPTTWDLPQAGADRNQGLRPVLVRVVAVLATVTMIVTFAHTISQRGSLHSGSRDVGVAAHQAG